MTKYARNSKTISGRLEDEMVMLDIDQGKYFSLNQTATTIWGLLEKPMDIDEICKRLVEEYDVGIEQCTREANDYVAEMLKLGLITKENK